LAITIKEVARQAGVSIATVSRFLNGTGPVSEEASRRIREAAERLRYVPHGGARSLITNRTNTVGVILPDIHGDYFSELLRGIDRASRRTGYHVLVSGYHTDASEFDAVLRATRGRVDGLIVMSPELNARAFRASLPDLLPVVVLNSTTEGDDIDSLSFDNYGGAVSMVRHLAAVGHRLIAFITGPEGNHDAHERLRGYRDALRELGLPHSPQHELPGDFTETGGYRAGAQLLALAPRPDAVFAANDETAMGLTFALRDAGILVPRDISLAGFDDVPIARVMSPPLTSVRTSIVELGERAMQRVVEALANKSAHRRRVEVLPTELVVRESCRRGRATAQDGRADP
jgi:LacI family transcriptional regulator